MLDLSANRGGYTMWVRIRRLAAALDLVGLVLLAAGVALLLIPLTLSTASPPPRPEDSSFSSPRTLSGRAAGHAGAFVAGLALIGAFLWWDLRHASSPVIARPFVESRSVLVAAAIGFFDFVRSLLSAVAA
jgi:hypothetical protein